uniref:Extended synaptotagmin-2 n=1 Tax=Phallusia mammillata TaxID=59560 RepID=A0A6F9DC56_9ASCI|nr:extended synaptotagmin-2 [Phallusia mammillata]
MSRRNDSGFSEENGLQTAPLKMDNETFKDGASDKKGNEPKEKKTNSQPSTIQEIVQSVLWAKVTSTLDLLRIGTYKFALASLAWFLGYFNFSLLWIFCGVGVMLFVAEKIQKRKIGAEVSKMSADDPSLFIEKMKTLYRSEGRQLPAWIYFPDMEKAEWLNKMLQQLWPNIGDYVKDLLTNQVQKSIQNSSSLLSSFTFTDVNLGDRSPRIAGIKVYDKALTRPNEIIMDLQLVYDSECNYGVSINGLEAGICDLQIRGLLRVELYPLIPRLPIVGAVSVSFIRDPQIDFNLTHLANLFDLPGIDGLLRGAVVDCIGGLMVMPERYIVKLNPDLDISLLKYPLPKGVVRIHVIEAKNLEEKDKKVLGFGGGSDPFVTIKVYHTNSLNPTSSKPVGHHQKFKTATIEHNINPHWNETFDVMVADIPLTTAEFLLFDDDGPLNKADDLGSASIPIKSVYDQGVVDEWFNLSDASTGAIHVKLEWMDLSSDINDLDKIQPKSMALLNIFANSAQLLAEGNEESFDPSPVLKISVPNKEPMKTQAAPETSLPVWEENFCLLVEDPKKQVVTFEVENSSAKGTLGRYELPLQKVLNAEDMTLDEPIRLQGAGTKSVLSCKITLRLLCPKEYTPSESGAQKITVHSKPKSSAADSTDSGNTSKEKLSVRGSDSGSETSGGIEFVDKNLQLFYETGTSPSHTSIGLNRTPSISSEISNPGALNDLRKRLNAKMQNVSENVEEKVANALGRIKLTHRYHNNKLVVVVVRAENLIVCDVDNETSDPYVRIYLNNDKGKRKKTRVIKNNLDPVYDQKLEFDAPLRELTHGKLNVTVKNQTGFLSSEKVLMGQVTIDLSATDLNQPTTQWSVHKVVNVHNVVMLQQQAVAARHNI